MEYMLGGIRILTRRIAAFCAVGCFLMVAMHTSSLRAQTVQDADLFNDARRMSSFADLMFRSKQRIKQNWLPGMSFGMTTGLVYENVSNVPVLLGNSVEEMDVVRGYTDIQLLYVPTDRSWSFGLTAAGMAYGLNRTFSVTGGSGGGGGDAFGEQFLDAAYIAKGSIGQVKFRAGYLSSKTLIPEPGSAEALGGEIVDPKAWLNAQIDAYGFKGSFQSSLSGGKAIEQINFDINLYEALRSFGAVAKDFNKDLKLPAFSLLNEFTSYAEDAADTVKTGYEIGRAVGDLARGNDYFLGLRMNQAFEGLFRSKVTSKQGNEYGHEIGVRLEAEAHVGLLSGTFRDTTAKLTVSSLLSTDASEERKPRQLGDNELSYGYAITAGYSRFEDPIALPQLASSGVEAVDGFEASLVGLGRLSMQSLGVLSIDLNVTIRKNWAADLKRVAEYYDVLIFYLGGSLSYGY